MGETDDSSSLEVPKTQNSEPKTQNFLYPFTPHTPLPHPSRMSRGVVDVTSLCRLQPLTAGVSVVGFVSVTLFRRGASLPLVVGVMVVIKDA